MTRYPEEMMTGPRLVAVYGTLRRGEGLHRMIASCRCLGTFRTAPTYSLYSLGGCPGLREGGSTAVTVEVYEIADRSLLEQLDHVEGAYDRKPVALAERADVDDYRKIPDGVEVYVYKRQPEVGRLIESGDWIAFERGRRAALEAEARRSRIGSSPWSAVEPTAAMLRAGGTPVNIAKTMVSMLDQEQVEAFSDLAERIAEVAQEAKAKARIAPPPAAPLDVSDGEVQP